MMPPNSNPDPEVGGRDSTRDDSAQSADPPGPNSKNSFSNYCNPTKKKLAIGSVLVACVAAICIGVTVPITKRNKEVAQNPQEGGSGQDVNQEKKDNDTAVFPDGEGKGEVTSPSGSTVTNRFNVNIPAFSPQVMDPYGSCTGLVNDLEEALKLLANSIIEENKDNDCSWYGPMWEEGGPETIFLDPATEEPVAFRTGSGPVITEEAAPESSRNQDAETSYETNNQVEGVDEADAVKSDGTYMFAAYGAELVVLDLEGNVIDRITIPDPPNVREDEEEEESVISGSFGSGAQTIVPPSRHRRRRTIKSLLLDKDRGVVTVIAYYEHSYNYRQSKIVSGGVTTAYIFDYTTGELVSNGSIDIPGQYQSARTIKNHAHVISSTNIDTSAFTSLLDRCRVDYDGMDGAEYEMSAFHTAEETVSEFARQLVNELKWDSYKGDGKAACDHIVRISSYAEPAKYGIHDEGNTSSTARMLDLTEGHDLLKSFVQITSFDTSKGSLGSLRHNVHVAGAFIPSSSATSETYASEDFIILAGRGYRQSDKDSSWSQYTFLMSFELNDDGKAIQHAVGEVKGYLLNQFSMDYHDGVLRIATTNREKWGFVEDATAGADRWKVIEDSSSQVTKLHFVDGEMRKFGELEGIGRTERITSCRFMGDRAYVVTFRLKDPLYVIDMNPATTSDPKVLGELNITGYSSYIHPVGVNDEFLLTVGQEADPKTGWDIGMKISLFDVSNAAIPREVWKFVENEDGGSSSSPAEWDHHAFRYLEGSQKLILPLSKFRWKSESNFDGFAVYDVSPESGIKPIGNVTHGNSKLINDNSHFWCFGRASLPARSLVFSGDLITFKGHSVKMSRDLTKLEEGWTKNLDEERTKGEDECFDYFWW